MSRTMNSTTLATLAALLLIAAGAAVALAPVGALAADGEARKPATAPAVRGLVDALSTPEKDVPVLLIGYAQRDPSPAAGGGGGPAASAAGPRFVWFEMKYNQPYGELGTIWDAVAVSYLPDRLYFVRRGDRTADQFQRPASDKYRPIDFGTPYSADGWDPAYIREGVELYRHLDRSDLRLVAVRTVGEDMDHAHAPVWCPEGDVLVHAGSPDAALDLVYRYLPATRFSCWDIATPLDDGVHWKQRWTDGTGVRAWKEAVVEYPCSPRTPTELPGGGVWFALGPPPRDPPREATGARGIPGLPMTADAETAPPPAPVRLATGGGIEAVKAAGVDYAERLIRPAAVATGLSDVVVHREGVHALLLPERGYLVRGTYGGKPADGGGRVTRRWAVRFQMDGDTATLRYAVARRPAGVAEAGRRDRSRPAVPGGP